MTNFISKGIDKQTFRYRILLRCSQSLNTEIVIEFENYVRIYSRFTKLTVTLIWSGFDRKYVTFTRRLINWDPKIRNNIEEEPLGFPSGDILNANGREFLYSIVLFISTLEKIPSVKRGLNVYTFENALIRSFVIVLELLINTKNNPSAYTKLT